MIHRPRGRPPRTARARSKVFPVTQTATATAAVPAPKLLPDAQTVTAVRHWNDRLFSFRVTRPQSLRFRSGEFVMIGLMGDNGKPLLRAYSIASPAWDEELEFYSIKVPDGPLTSKLQHIKPGDEIILRPKPVGTLVHDALLPGKRVWFLATGTGLAPFASLMREPETYEKFDEVVMMHTCRTVDELEYGRVLVESLKEDPLIGELVGDKLKYYPTTTREDFPRMGRITENLKSGKVFADLGIAPMSAETDRAMVCGSLAFNKDVMEVLEGFGLREGANSEPKEYVVEKAFVGEGV
ncbi:ferredoxin--NADP reductase [Sinirhodobacter populi]|nr:ferredoxin--NADP reductase [Sinirhodobacter populi]RWR09371.1 ferredoxin--NADP reductase [Sinirhodobacter populi]